LHDRAAYAEGKRATLENCVAARRATVDALEASHLSYTLWCYTSDHTPEWGDGWNREDLSIFSRSAAPEVPVEVDPFGVHLGGRALAAFVRPYVQALAGTLVRTPVYDSSSGEYELLFRHSPTIDAPSLLFVPAAVQYRDGFAISISDGEYSIEAHSPEEGYYSIIRYSPDRTQAVHLIQIGPRGAPRRARFSGAASRGSPLGLRTPLTKQEMSGMSMLSVSRMNTT
jgi:hypothetical protein